MTRTIYREKIPSTDARLRRHIHHDDHSRLYAFDTTGLTIQSVRHARRIAVLDQGQVGSCTGNAGIGCLGTDPYYETVGPSATAGWANQTDAPIVATPSALRSGTQVRYTLDEAGALALYSDAETIDGDGPYPPNDNGSTGLSVAKALKAAGEIAGYQHTFTLNDALKALSQYPLITGINWYNDMFNPDANGLVHPTGSLAGGHEIVVDEYDATRGWVGFTNSWGADWGVAGRFYMQAEDWGTLLARQGDVTIFTPLSQPAPTPTPAPPGPSPQPDPNDLALVRALDPWARGFHIGANARAAKAYLAWKKAEGL